MRSKQISRRKVRIALVRATKWPVEVEVCLHSSLTTATGEDDW
jgi:hypothetical protein